MFSFRPDPMVGPATTEDAMTVNSNNAINDAELDGVSGGSLQALTPVQTPAQKAAQELKDAYLASHSIELGPFQKPHEVFPKLW
jgi:hypothetical protein